MFLQGWKGLGHTVKAGQGDTRKVQTAVVGGARSQEAARMPEDRQQALRYRNRFLGRSFWCGYWLGGCGKRLSGRVGRERIPHFAHIPDAIEPHRCRRENTGSDSADHLYITSELHRWLTVQQGVSARKPELAGDFAEGGTCREANLDTVSGQGRITVHFTTGLEGPGFHTPDDLAWHTRLFGPKIPPRSPLVRTRGYGLVLRVKADPGAEDMYRTEVGTAIGTTLTWVGLDQCKLTERGLTTPALNRAWKKGKAQKEREPESGRGADREAEQTEQYTENPVSPRLPLDVEQIVVLPKRKGTVERLKVEGSDRYRHSLPVNLHVVGEDTHQAVLWFPEHVGGLKKGAAHLIVPPAWVEMAQRTERRWDLKCEGLARVMDPGPGAVPPVLLEERPSGGGTDDQSPVSVVDADEEAPVEPTAEAERWENLVRVAEQFVSETGPVEDTAQEQSERSVPVPSPTEWASGVLCPPKDPVRALTLVEGLGERWLMLCLADVLTNNGYPMHGGFERRWLTEARERTLARISSWPELASVVPLDQGEESQEDRGQGDETNEPQAEDAREGVGPVERTVLQFAGILALRGNEALLASLVERACQELLEAQRWRQIGWVNYVAEHLESSSHTITHVRSAEGGPEAARVVIRDDRDRVAEGAGKTDEQALKRASQRFAEDHLVDDAVRWPTVGGLRWHEIAARSPYASHDTTRHAMVERLRDWGLSEPGAGQLYQGLDDKLATVTHQGGVVGRSKPFVYVSLLGGTIRAHAHALAALSGAVVPDEETAPEPLLEEHWVDPVKDCLETAANGTPGDVEDAAEVGEDLTQQIMAVVLSTAEREGTPAPVEPVEPVEPRGRALREGEPSVGTVPGVKADASEEPVTSLVPEESGAGAGPVAPGEGRPAGTSRVEDRFREFEAHFEAQWGVRFSPETGAEASGQRMRLALRQRTVSGTADGPLVHGRLRSSRAAVASAVMGMVDRLSGSAQWGLEQQELPFARLLMRLQLEVVPSMSDEKRALSRDRGYLGAGSLRKGDVRGFRSWARQVEQLCGQFPADQVEYLADYYREAVREGAAARPRALSQVCAELARAVALAEAEGDASFPGRAGGLAVGLMDLSSILRAPQDPEAGSGWFDVAQGLPRATERLVHYGSRDPGGRQLHPGRVISQREARALAYLVRVLGRFKDGRPAPIEVRQSNSGTEAMVHRAKKALSDDQRLLAALVLEAVPSLSVGFSGSIRTIRVRPGVARDRLARLGEEIWGLSGHSADELVRVGDRLHEVGSQRADGFRSAVSFGSGQWKRIRRELARFS